MAPPRNYGKRRPHAPPYRGLINSGPNHFSSAAAPGTLRRRLLQAAADGDLHAFKSRRHMISACFSAHVQVSFDNPLGIYCFLIPLIASAKIDSSGLLWIASLVPLAQDPRLRDKTIIIISLAIIFMMVCELIVY